MRTRGRRGEEKEEKGNREEEGEGKRREEWKKERGMEKGAEERGR